MTDSTSDVNGIYLDSSGVVQARGGTDMRAGISRALPRAGGNLVIEETRLTIFSLFRLRDAVPLGHGCPIPCAHFDNRSSTEPDQRYYLWRSVRCPNRTDERVSRSHPPFRRLGAVPASIGVPLPLDLDE